PSGSTATFVNDHKLNGFFYLGDDLSIKLKKINNEGKSISPVHETGVDSMPYIFPFKRIEYNTSENSFYKNIKDSKIDYIIVDQRPPHLRGSKRISHPDILKLLTDETMYLQIYKDSHRYIFKVL
ncbi:MAG: hypothetical protein CME61_00980, partial [Halobacteriovoraceae bacterium]|nr:hypothetical protein [Halobacteriovoraceae bacterium]